MFQPPTPLDIRVNHQLVGRATDAVTAHEINERLDVMANWMVSEDATAQSIAWDRWLEIARLDQLPPRFDPNWKEWKIQCSVGGGNTTAAIRWIASQLGNQSTLIHVISEYAAQSTDLVGMLAGQSGMNFHFPRDDSCYFETGAVAKRYDTSRLDDLARTSFGPSEILWLDNLLVPPRHLIGKLHSFTHTALRSRARVVWSG